MSPEAGPEVLRLTFDEIAALPGSLTDAEVARAKESMKGNVMLSLESTGSRMNKLARSELYYGRQIGLDEIIGRIDAVTTDAVRQMALEIFTADQLAMAAIGPFGVAGTTRGDVERTFADCLGRLPAPHVARVASTAG